MARAFARRCPARQKNQSRGSINELRQQVQTVERELVLARYRDADTEYRRLLIEKKTRALAIEDLAKYYKAVDGCVGGSRGRVWMRWRAGGS